MLRFMCDTHSTHPLPLQYNFIRPILRIVLRAVGGTGGMDAEGEDDADVGINMPTPET